jgi:hypothetical protein
MAISGGFVAHSWPKRLDVTEKRKQIDQVEELNEAQPLRAVMTLPVEWVIRGFVRAIGRVREAEEARRLDEASGRTSTARDATIALAEASTWLDILIVQFPELRDNEHVLVLQFVRERTHHHWAGAIYFDRDRSAYVWYPEENLPLPREQKYRKDTRRQGYVRLLEGRPVDEVLAQLERRVIALAPNADLD